jgi:hypothetical protein
MINLPAVRTTYLECWVPVDKMCISMEQELGERIRAAAGRASVSLLAWLAGAAAASLRRRALDGSLASWQAEHGDITPEELAKARRELGYATDLVA